MHLLVTRPEPDDRELRARLEAMGHRVSVSPLLEIELVEGAPISVDGVQALIVTSRNGLRGLAQRLLPPEAYDLPLFAVGPATARLARDLGFTRTIQGAGDAHALVGVIKAHAMPGAGSLLHAMGEHTAFDLRMALSGEGYTVRDEVIYRSQPAECLVPEIAEAIARGAIDGVMLMSPRTARTFADLARKAGLAAAAGKLACFCLSQAVADALSPLAPFRVHIARRPNLEELLAVLASVAPESA